MKRQFMFALVYILALGACLPQKRIPTPPMDDHASVKIAEAADAVSQSIVELARIEAAAMPPAPGSELPDPGSYGIKQIATVDWSGPIGPLVNRLANAISYRLTVLGNEPAVPIIITLSAHNAPVSSILRDIDFQAGYKAHIVVYPQTKQIELRYAKA